ncbi:MAG: restriction endonuclease [Candidatus Omnitrophota bacterium]
MVKWRDYEGQIFAYLRRLCPEKTRIFRKYFLDGRHSNRKRQIDILIFTRLNNKKVVIVVDCKCFNAKITLPRIDSFYGFLDDVNVDMGLMITTKGFSKAASKRARKGNITLETIDLNSDYKKMPYFSLSCCEYCTVNRTDCPLSLIYWDSHLAFIDKKDGKPRTMMIGLCSSCYRIYVNCGRCNKNVEVPLRKIGEKMKCDSCNFEFRVFEKDNLFRIELIS